MTQEFTIRPAAREDAASLHGLICGLAAYEKLEDEVVATPESLADSLFGERPGAQVRIAERGTEAIGYALFFPTYSTFLALPGLWLEDLFVLPECRGEGVGKALFSCVAARALQLHPEGRLEWSVLDWNAPALRFYERLGARPQDEWTTHRLVGESLHLLAGLHPRPFDTV